MWRFGEVVMWRLSRNYQIATSPHHHILTSPYHFPMPPASHQHLAIYAGSFDPITLGHLDVLRRARRLFDGIILGIGRNPDKESMFSMEERQEMAQILVDELLEAEPDGCPVRVE